jgi:hypothetical protein
MNFPCFITGPEGRLARQPTKSPDLSERKIYFTHGRCMQVRRQEGEHARSHTHAWYGNKAPDWSKNKKKIQGNKKWGYFYSE